MTPFGEIIRRAVESTPDAVGGSFADSTGEMVDCFAKSYNPLDWAILTAHYGVILANLQAVFGIWHFGGPEFFVAQHQSLGIVVQALDGGYFALIAVDRKAKGKPPDDDFANHALASLRVAAPALHREMA
ncbi:MAG: hypothetical protein H0V17_03490 [Deltaproteobacteria bacterium]|nr:hypothetical protein [Deltaproteobacteria bacterium]